VADDLGWGDVGCFGGDLETHRLDRLAAEGARLTSFYSAAPVCTPSRYALLTGRHPLRAEGGLGGVLMMLDPAHAERGLTPREVTLAEVLGRAGYRTGLVGKWHLGHGGPEQHPARHGFEEFYGLLGGCVDYETHRYAWVPDWWRGHEAIVEAGYATDLLTDAALDFLAQPTDERPFLLVLSHVAPHYGKSLEGAMGPGTLATRRAGPTTVDPESGRELEAWNTLQARPADLAAPPGFDDPARRHYAAMVRALDDGVGRVLDLLDERGLAEDTIVLFVADNGPDRTPSSAGASGPLRGGKHGLHEGGVRVPAILRWPGRIAPGSTIDAVGSLLDVLPTWGALAGAELAGLELDGLDLGPVWLEDRALERDLVWSHGRASAFRRGPWKLVDGSLYRLDEDPGERHDRAADRPALTAELTAARAAALAGLSR